VLLAVALIGAATLVVLAVLVGLALRQDDEIRARPERHDRGPD
jgi:hypothetical protein